MHGHLLDGGATIVTRSCSVRCRTPRPEVAAVLIAVRPTPYSGRGLTIPPAEARTRGTRIRSVMRYAALVLPAILAGFAGVAPPTAAGAKGVARDAAPAERMERAVASGDIELLRSLRTAIAGRAAASALDRYNLAYLDWRIGQLLPAGSRKEKKALLKEAQKQLDSILGSFPDDAEAHALRGTTIGERITGMFGGMFLGPKATASLRRAAALEPDNPRVALLRGVAAYFTPRTFGGGFDEAERELRRACKLFEDEPADKPWPNWGRVDAFAWLGRTLAEEDRLDEARSAYRAALALVPDHAWVRDELLPELERAVAERSAAAGTRSRRGP